MRAAVEQHGRRYADLRALDIQQATEPALDALRGAGVTLDPITHDAFVSPSRSRSLTITSLTGPPALVLKAGFSGGLPVALMMTGRLYDEATLLQLALAYERRTDWHTRHPVLT